MNRSAENCVLVPFDSDRRQLDGDVNISHIRVLLIYECINVKHTERCT